MDVFAEYLEQINTPQHRNRLQEVLDWVAQKFPDLEKRIAWNQPMFTHHGTFIIGFSIAKHHIAVAPEKAALDHFSDDIAQSGYEFSKQLIRIPWDSPLDFSLLEKLIAFNIADKADYKAFWRK